MTVGLLVGVPLSLVFLYLAVRGLNPGDLADTLARAKPVPVVAFACTFPFVRHPAWLRHVFVAAMVLGALIAAALAIAGWHVGGSRLPVRMVSERLRRSWAGRQLAGVVRGTGAVVNRRDALV